MIESVCHVLQMQPGSAGAIQGIEGMDPVLRRRLADLGVSEGCTVCLKGKGPFMGPVMLECNGQLLAIRRKEASKIVVNVS
ncbi:ferrous iron transport protein A [Paenibacillus forsythiae]|uniref:Ferrous iron transport protein A n=1 Tax=Paenibacillus forsythiae TaxID=365616 RepID=A0ABU3H7C2_9BACL|nr:FeoA family protein [Paenibacillus forsythiae]MDT3425927.1 ferrous iron transport protein A [Paenibacillus forsythiae]